MLSLYRPYSVVISLIVALLPDCIKYLLIKSSAVAFASSTLIFFPGLIAFFCAPRFLTNDREVITPAIIRTIIITPTANQSFCCFKAERNFFILLFLLLTLYRLL